MKFTGDEVAAAAAAVTEAGRRLPVRRLDGAVAEARRAVPGSSLAVALAEAGGTIASRMRLLADACETWSADVAAVDATLTSTDASLGRSAGAA